MFNGKIHYKWPFSIAMLNYQRVPKHIHWMQENTPSLGHSQSDQGPLSTILRTRTFYAPRSKTSKTAMFGKPSSQPPSTINYPHEFSIFLRWPMAFPPLRGSPAPTRRRYRHRTPPHPAPQLHHRSCSGTGPPFGGRRQHGPSREDDIRSCLGSMYSNWKTTKIPYTI